ncbi:Benzylsuccinate synthase gamma subunit [uncultured Desulfobacterium sp.]|uniref:Benzylsuccinate synthase gamma subunit n=1 Tax=uncultured Desulfobacterium sp. TaxID=201089 RepID=A0A445MQH9_9BACT|nr:Benzylsuccinate synthase gamma subunit [uncultured Desulfobacterium sp.]
MPKCEECTYFNPISKESADAGSKNGDCVIEKKDEKGKFWLAKEVDADTESCSNFQKR